MINGDRVRELRQKKGASQYQMAKDSDLFQPIINRIEAGKNPNPNIKTIQKIAKYFGVKIEDLLISE